MADLTLDELLKMLEEGEHIHGNKTPTLGLARQCLALMDEVEGLKRDDRWETIAKRSLESIKHKDAELDRLRAESRWMPDESCFLGRPEPGTLSIRISEHARLAGGDVSYPYTITVFHGDHPFRCRGGYQSASAAIEMLRRLVDDTAPPEQPATEDER